MVQFSIAMLRASQLFYGLPYPCQRINKRRIVTDQIAKIFDESLQRWLNILLMLTYAIADQGKNDYSVMANWFPEMLEKMCERWKLGLNWPF